MTAASTGAWEGRATSLQIAGLTPLSTVDWPGRLVATAFLQGCPWRCTYCHNSAILDPTVPGVVAWSDVMGLLRRRRGLLDGLVLSGGEPTRQAGVVAAAREAKEAGFLVGLHTAGAYPARLPGLLRHVDWVGLDIKAPAHLYRAITRTGDGATAAGKAFAALRIVLDSGVDVQVRTTVDPTVLTDADVAELTAALADMGVRDHVLQQVRPDGATDEYAQALAGVPRERLHRG
ncbi:anaerobic ribonucleoside-triphosphate reductase activating protein [Cellulomonas sp. S1-8]|uniref:anaerobic ribonucleoside-triphosphate reductase activating protein n=1 Tax=Cellulomonas sp. S1-8 TaxID=2904790 RepID=UPI0022445E7C|nr:anaerobic ribonucleoside-triphosphate reductase activating protein [Cellulomonas sp. S1-8]UZN02429.1 anaerobic ribonucleoside-triphosphate reductase activating protein [Cellulomonas sp. S1-8]